MSLCMCTCVCMIIPPIYYHTLNFVFFGVTESVIITDSFISCQYSFNIYVCIEEVAVSFCILKYAHLFIIQTEMLFQMCYYRQPVFCDWAFNLERGEPLQKKWDLIPEDTDILITHGPPIGKHSN